MFYFKKKTLPTTNAGEDAGGKRNLHTQLVEM
jgi:hypothetical protein